MRISYSTSLNGRLPFAILPCDETTVKTGRFPKKVRALVGRYIKEKRFTGAPKETLVLSPTLAGLPRELALVGLGPREKVTSEMLLESGALAMNLARERKQVEVALFLPSELLVNDRYQFLIDGALLTNYYASLYKTGKEASELKRQLVRSLTIVTDTPLTSQSRSRIREALTTTANVDYARSLISRPSSEVTPEYLETEARELSNRYPAMTLTSLDKAQLTTLGMGLILGVNRGSTREPRLVILDWNPRQEKEQPIVIVGKGITFDSGGYNLKPTGSMEDMHGDMAGAATVLAVMRTVAELRVPLRVVGLFPATENVVSGDAYKPSDVLTSFSGKTVEVGNTDAEGRLILADALAYAVKTFKPRYLIDLATLTGACIVALGERYAGLLGTDTELMEKIERASSMTAERVWRLPLDDYFSEKMKGTIADLRNVAPELKRAAGASLGAAFLKEFVGETAWAHLDIAGPALRQDKTAYDPKTVGTGFGVRLMVEFLKLEADQRG
ncbi:MAG: leucyl aminopeptidase [Parcubacteria group bacterium]|nr:leucyl aminopeptidase [Parcubacteria group bacterium]